MIDCNEAMIILINPDRVGHGAIDSRMMSVSVWTLHVNHVFLTLVLLFAPSMPEINQHDDPSSSWTPIPPAKGMMFFDTPAASLHLRMRFRDYG